ncbi:MAG: hypothetical protein KGI02_03040 [Thaumarchaeota archaeon]|nr:hypothetical protein [Nitrososphaerota archaeon]MDE1877920.1 hypothetical protein [Nitrososphaerota archaeon]
MKALHLTAIISGTILVTIAILFITIHKPTNQNGVYDYAITDYVPDTNKTWGTDIIQNQTFHFVDYNMSVSLPKSYWIDMYDTNFTFPNGLKASLTAGGAIFEAYVTFPNETVPYRMVMGLGNSSDHKVITVLSTHKDPQAGYAIFNNTVRLLVNWPKIHSDILLVGFNDTYETGQPIDFQIRVNGFDYFDAAETPEFKVKGADGRIVWSQSDINGLRLCCPQELVNYDKMFNMTRLGGPIIIDKAGLYDLVVSYNHQQITKQFSVIASHNTSIFDTGVYPFFVNVENSNFTINYNISGNNKLLDAKMDSQSKSLILSLKSTGNGTLIVSIPRALLDAKTNDNQDDQFIILEDGQEIDYKQLYSTIMDRVLSIQFQNNTSQIEIIVTQIV